MSKRPVPKIASFFGVSEPKRRNNITDPPADNPIESPPEKAVQNETVPQNTCNIRPDIGHIVDLTDISRNEKYFYLTNLLSPPENFDWPFEERRNGNTTEKRFLRKDHLLKHKFLAFCIGKKGL